MTRVPRILVFTVPVILFALVAGAFYVGLHRDPSRVPSPLIGKPAPAFDLPAAAGAERGFSTSDLKKGRVSLVNAFASWCPPCHAEHPLLMQLQAETDIPIFGLNVKDKPADVRAFLEDKGNPYTAVGADASGRVGIDWGVSGYPETFVVAGDGTILYRHVGQLTEAVLEDTILPMVREHRE